MAGAEDILDSAYGPDTTSTADVLRQMGQMPDDGVDPWWAKRDNPLGAQVDPRQMQRFHELQARDAKPPTDEATLSPAMRTARHFLAEMSKMPGASGVGFVPGPMGGGMVPSGIVGPLGMKRLAADYPAITPTLREWTRMHNKGATLMDLHEMSADRLRGTPIASVTPDPLTRKPVGEISDLPLRTGLDRAMDYIGMLQPGRSGQLPFGHAGRGPGDISPSPLDWRNSGVNQRGMYSGDPASIITHPVLERAYPNLFKNTQFEVGLGPSEAVTSGIRGTGEPVRMIMIEPTLQEVHRTMAHEFSHPPQGRIADNMSRGGGPNDVVFEMPLFKERLAMLEADKRRSLSERERYDLANDLLANHPTFGGDVVDAYRRLAGELAAEQSYVGSGMTRDQLAASPRWMRTLPLGTNQTPMMFHPEIGARGLRMSRPDQEARLRRATDEVLAGTQLGLPFWRKK